MKLAYLVIAVAGCTARSHSTRAHLPTTPEAAVSRSVRGPGDALVYRFIDHAGDAQLTSPSLAEAWRELAYPAKIVDPYVGLRGDDAARVIELALPDADVASYGTPHPLSPARARTLRFDPVWNRTRAVYESKRSLFAVGESQYRFTIPPAANGELQVAIAIPPMSQPTEFVMALDGQARWQRMVTANEAGSWIPITIPAPNVHELAFITHGPERSAAVWGDPVLLNKGAGTPGPNVLFVIIDTLRVDALPVMPRLQKLAAEGTQLDQTITAATWTRPSVLAMLGGDLPTAIGQSAEEMIPSDGDRRRFYAVAPPLLPRVLEAHGYRAVAMGNNFFLLGYPQIGLTLGFDEVDDIRHPVLDTPAITNAAVTFIEQHRDQPWLLHLHYDAPHWPYTPPPQYLKNLPSLQFPQDALTREYLGEAAYADAYLGQVIDALDRLHLSERTLVVVVGDHGEIFDHAHSYTVHALNQPTLHHHGWSGYDELLRVPLIFRMPGTVPQSHVSQQVSLVDVEPTILDLLGLPPRPGARGRSLVPLWRGETQAERPAFVEGQDVRVLRDHQWAYLRRSDGNITLPDGRHENRAEELYDLAADPEEHVNLATKRPDKLATMRTLFEHEAPTQRDAPISVLHLRVSPDDRDHVVDGTLRSDGAIALRGVAGAEASPVDAHTLRLTLRGAAQVDLAIDPPTARLELALRRDGTPLLPGQILLGEFGLPLMASATQLLLDGDRLTWIDAARPPVLGEHGEVLMWRDPSKITPLGLTPTKKSSSEVAGMMRRWGYAQQGTASTNH
jgi:arylsulfatase A-like enzyme